MLRKALKCFTSSISNQQSTPQVPGTSRADSTSCTTSATSRHPSPIGPASLFPIVEQPHNSAVPTTSLQTLPSPAHGSARSPYMFPSDSRPAPSSSFQNNDYDWNGPSSHNNAEGFDEFAWENDHSTTQAPNSGHSYTMSPGDLRTAPQSRNKNAGTKPPSDRFGLMIRLSAVDQRKLESFPTDFEANTWLKSVMFQAAGVFLSVQAFYRFKEKLYFITDSDEDARRVQFAIRLEGFPRDLDFTSLTTVVEILRPMFMFAVLNVDPIPELSQEDLKLRYKEAFQASYPDREVIPFSYRSQNKMLVKIPNVDDANYFYGLSTTRGDVRLNGTEYPIRAWSHARESKQCYNCYLPGHTASGNQRKGLGRCSNIRCPNCAGYHRAEECSDPSSTVCCICDGIDHKATHWRKCRDPRIQQMAKEIEEAQNTPPRWAKSLGLDLLPANPAPVKKAVSRKRKAEVIDESRPQSQVSSTAPSTVNPGPQVHASEQIAVDDSAVRSNEQQSMFGVQHGNMSSMPPYPQPSHAQRRRPLGEISESVVNTQAQRFLHQVQGIQAMNSPKTPQDQPICISSSPTTPRTSQSSPPAAALSTPATDRTSKSIDLERRLQLSSDDSSDYGSPTSLPSSVLQDLEFPPPDPELAVKKTPKPKRVAFRIPASTGQSDAGRSIKRTKTQHPSDKENPDQGHNATQTSEVNSPYGFRASTRPTVRQTYQFAPSLSPSS